jgi:hypothetical protein
MLRARLPERSGRSQVWRWWCAVFHLWRSLDEHPDNLRSPEAAVHSARLATGQGGLAFLPLAVTGFEALTSAGAIDWRLASWVQGAHRAVLSVLIGPERLSR